MCGMALAASLALAELVCAEVMGSARSTLAERAAGG